MKLTSLQEAVKISEFRPKKQLPLRPYEDGVPRNYDNILPDTVRLQREKYKDLPEDIWNRYSKETFYNAFYLSNKSEKKMRRSKKKSM